MRPTSPITRASLATAMAVSLLLLGACSGDDRTTSADAEPTSTSVASTTTSPSNATDEPDFTAVAAAVDSLVSDKQLNGAGLVIVDRETGVIYEHYNGEFGPDRVSLIASSSKMLTAGVLMRLDDLGLLDMDAPVSAVTEWGASHPDVTPAQLVSNSSGLIGLLQGNAAPYGCQYAAAGTMADCAETIFTTPDDDADVIPPDTEFRYGGAQWQVAGAVAEIASGKSWAELIDETYVKPCKLTSLAYNNHYTQIMSPKGPFAYPAQFNGDPTTLAPTDNPNMEGGAYASPTDYAELLLMHLRGGKCGDQPVLSSAAVDRMHRDRIGEVYNGTTKGKLEGYGLGWWVDRTQPGLIEDAGAFGAVPWLDLERGYGAYLVIEDTATDGALLARTIRPMIQDEIDAHSDG